MKKRIIAIVCLLAFILFAYLNRSYAHIYKTIDDSALQSPVRESVYDFGNQPQEPNVYVAIGDSLTSGVGVESFEQSYPYQVAELLSENDNQVELKTFAVQGARSLDALVVLDEIIKTSPDIITILLGTNDIHGNIFRKTFRENYAHILNRLTEETDATVYVISVPFTGTADLLLPPYGHYFDWQTRRFNETLKELSREYSVEYIDLYTATRSESSKEGYYSLDLFHPSEKGYTLWSNIVYDHINP